MTDPQASNLRMYINDMLAVERDIYHAISTQAKDETIGQNAAVHALVEEIATSSGERVKTFEALAEKHSSQLGAAAKEAVATAAGVLAGLYGKVRKHPVSRMLRDDHVALNLASIAYGMLYTTAVAFDAPEVADAARLAVDDTSTQVGKLTSIIPGVVVKELSKEGPTNPTAESLAVGVMHSAWEKAA